MSDVSNSNPREVIGDNSGVNYAADMTAEIGRESAGLFKDAEALMEEAKKLVEAGRVIAEGDEARAGVFAALYKKVAGINKILIAKHDAMKLPHKVRAETVDSVYFGYADKLIRRNSKANAGIGDILWACYDDWNQRKLRTEELARQRALEEAARKEREAAEAAAEAARIAEEARLAAERARAPAQVEAKTEVAVDAENAADSLKVDAIMATDQADAAELRTKAKPADMVRTRYDGGVMGTMQTVPFAEITDRDLLMTACAKLWPHIPLAALQTALNTYAGSVGHSSAEDVQLPGARFGKKPKTRIK